MSFMVPLCFPWQGITNETCELFQHCFIQKLWQQFTVQPVHLYGTNLFSVYNNCLVRMEKMTFFVIELGGMAFFKNGTVLRKLRWYY